MAGLLGFSRADALALPLTRQTVETVIARTRTANLAQMLVAIVVVAGLLVAGRSATGALASLFYGGAALAMWGVLATLLSAWDHFRTAATLRRLVSAEIARAPDPIRFWRAHRGLFPWYSG